MAERREALAVLVHFRGWKASYDEWITVDAGRLRQLEATSSTVGLAGSSTLWQPSRAALDSTPAPPATVPSASQLRVSPSPPPLPLALGSEADSRRACTSTGERHVHPHAHGEGKRARNGKASVKACAPACSSTSRARSAVMSSATHTSCRAVATPSAATALRAISEAGEIGNAPDAAHRRNGETLCATTIWRALWSHFTLADDLGFEDVN